MNTDHSSLCADTGLSDIHLNRLGIVPVNRQVSTYARISHNSNKDAHMDSGTLTPFDNGLSWFDDDDVKSNIDLLNKGQKRYAK